MIVLCLSKPRVGVAGSVETCTADGGDWRFRRDVVATTDDSRGRYVAMPQEQMRFHVPASDSGGCGQWCDLLHSRGSGHLDGMCLPGSSGYRLVDGPAENVGDLRAGRHRPGGAQDLQGVGNRPCHIEEEYPQAGAWEYSGRGDGYEKTDESPVNWKCPPRRRGDDVTESKPPLAEEWAGLEAGAVRFRGGSDAQADPSSASVLHESMPIPAARCVS